MLSSGFSGTGFEGSGVGRLRAGCLRGKLYVSSIIEEKEEEADLAPDEGCCESRRCSTDSYSTTYIIKCANVRAGFGLGARRAEAPGATVYCR